MTPETALYRLLCGLVLGAALGLYYGFLRPPRTRHPALADGAFLLGAVWVWLFFAFGICGGDLRVGYFAGLTAGGVIWECTAGKALRPVFGLFWKKLGNLGALLTLPGKKFLHFAKILFASGEKWVTIK